MNNLNIIIEAHCLSTSENCDIICELEREKFQVREKFNKFINIKDHFKINAINYK